MSGPYHRPHQWNWFTQRRAYKLFMIRELTSVFIALYTIVLLVFLYKLGQGEKPFVAFLGSLNHPGWMVLHAVALVASVWHTITWFQATPQAMPVFIGEERLRPAIVAIAMGYLPWVVVTILILWGTCP